MIGFQNPEILLLLVLALPGFYFVWTKSSRYGNIVSSLHAFIVLIMVVAVAGPYITVEEEFEQEREIVLLKDETTSSSLIQDYELDFETAEVREKVIASGNESDLRTGFERNMEPETDHLVVSDFQSETSLEEVGEVFSDANSTLSSFQPEMKDEASVSIEGPDSTVPGAANTFTVRVHSTSERPEPQVRLDGQTVRLDNKGEGVWEFEHSFSEEGSYEIEAWINHNGEFDLNDNYYHAVNVIEKPEILIVGEKGELEEQLEEFYEVDHRNEMPEEDYLEDYYSIIATERPFYEPIDFVSRGNGFVYTDEFDDGMSILPVREDPDSDEEDGAKLMIVFDISIAAGECVREAERSGVTVCLESEGEGGTVQQSKMIAYNLIEDLPYNNRVGVAAFNNEAVLIGEPEPLHLNRDFLLDRVARIDTGGPSHYHKGLMAGEEVLDDEGNIIFITDGKRHPAGEAVNTMSRSRDVADRLKPRLITVGVGEEPNRDFLEDLASRADGFYLDANDAGRLEFQFDAGGADGETVPLAVTNPNHFITDGLELSSSATYFESVQPKRGSDLLVTGTDGREFLTAWRYGVGRVAAFSGGSQDLSEVTDFDPELLTRTVSWSVGDPERKNDERIEIESARYPEEVEVRSSERFEGMIRQGSGDYLKTVEPEDLGFHSFNSRLYDYNYNNELESIGYSDGLRDVVSDAGGQVYESGDEERIEDELVRTEEQVSTVTQNLSNYLLALALVMFLAEVGYRKMNGKK